MNHPTLFTVVLSCLVAGCASLRSPVDDGSKRASVAFAEPATTRSGGVFAIEARRHPGASAFHLLSVGADGFTTRVEMADTAERTLDVQYFIFRNDRTGKVIADALLRAADRGVRVRLLLDDGETASGDEDFRLLHAHPNVEVRIFNPFAYRGHDKLVRAAEFALDAGRLDYRMHNKLFVADNAIALVGGRNVADEYFQIDPKRQFADDDLFAGGPMVSQLSKRFDEFWNSELAVPVGTLAGGEPTRRELEAFRETLAASRDAPMPDGVDYAPRIASGRPLSDLVSGALPLTWAASQVVCDSPDKKKVDEGWRVGRLMVRPVADAATAVRSELLMITPYLVPGREGMRLFEDLRGRGVTVRLLTNSLETSTVPAAQAGYMHYRPALLRDGVELFEIRADLGDSRGSGQTAAISRYGNYSLHGKMFVFDRTKVFIGSMNFDQRSIHLNTEIGLIIDSESLARQIVDRFTAMADPKNAYRLGLQASDGVGLTWDTEENGRPEHLRTEPARTPWQRLQVDALTLLPLDQEL